MDINLRGKYNSDTVDKKDAENKGKIMSGYTHITIAPKIAALGLIIEPDSNFNITARKEMALANAAPDLLAALNGMLALDDDIAQFDDAELMQAVASTDRNISQAAKAYVVARKAIRKATEI